MADTNGIEDELVFLPLGGCDEIGMNLNLYGLGPPGAETWVMVDLGVTFGDGTQPGVDVIMPDPGFIAERRDRLAGLVLTHAHEDHLGAVPYLWERLECPIYATPFTLSILRRKLAETDFADEIEIIEVPLSGRFTVGPESAGSTPGPICYGKGGTEPTISDANMLLGRMNAGQKVASFLLELTDRLGKAGAGGETLVILPLSRQQMADVLGLTIETVSRQLSRLRSAGLIDTPSRREIVLRDRRELEELAG